MATPLAASALNPHAAIGFFDSGVGGLSVLRHIQRLLPNEALIYFADSAYAPYGDKSNNLILERSLFVAEHLLALGIKALVVACNTATAAAIQSIRTRYPELILVGMEPGLKPALQLSTNRRVGVLATKATLDSEKYQTLRTQLSTQHEVNFISQACPGLVEHIELGELKGNATRSLLCSYIHPLLEQGVDTLVLGCTHYPFVAPLIHEVCSSAGHPHVRLIDTGEAIALQVQRLLTNATCLRPPSASTSQLQLVSSGNQEKLRYAAHYLLPHKY